MCSISTRLAIALAVLTLTSCARHFRAEGVVLSVDPANRRVVVSHKAIRGYMEPMAMPFRAAKPEELRGLAPGSRIDFRLNVSRKATSIGHIRLRQTGLDDVPLPVQTAKLSIGDPVPEFTLIDQSGAQVTLSDFRGRPVAIDFIYTRCPLPDVCPRLSANFALLQKRFGGRLVLLSVTIDPQFDTPQVLMQYARRWQAGPGWRFLTGTAKQIQHAAAPFGLIYWPEDGLIAHSSATALIGPDGRLAALLEGSTFTAAQLVDLAASVAGPATAR